MTHKSPARAAIVSASLINFNGIPFQHLEFDSTTTALEGRNGAGKTTAMIGCYLPLMPDQAFLKFKNISENREQVKADGNIYDRFGQSGDVAYSALQFRLADGSLFYAGVEVQKRPQKKFELTPFTIKGVSGGVPPEDLLMVRDAADAHCIAPLSTLGPHIISVGGTFRKYAKLSDYFHVLFEYGVAPTILTTTADRSKLHKLMMASFYGGLTADLQTSIKDYLLPENNDVKTSVERARSLLYEVRVTRQIIERAQETYAMVQKVDADAFDMMAAAYYSVKNQFDGSRADKQRARDELRSTKQQYRLTQARVAEVTLERVAAEALVVEAETALDTAKERLQMTKEAHALATEIRMLRPKVETLQQAHEVALTALAEAQEAAEAAARRRRTLLDDQRQLVATLGDARKAYEAISRKAGLYNAACLALAEVTALLGDQNVTPENAPLVRKAEEAALNADRWALEPAQRALQQAQDTADAFTPVHSALEALNGSPVTPPDAYAHGHALLGQYRGYAQTVADAAGIGERIRRAEQQARRQQQVRQALKGLASDDELITSVAQLRAAIALAAKLRDEQDAALERERTRRGDAMQLRAEKQLLIGKLSDDLRDWDQAAKVRVALRAAGGPDIGDGAALRTAEMTLEEAMRVRQQNIDGVTMRSAALAVRLTELQDNGARLGDRLNGLADRVGGKLVAELYDDVSLHDAARIEGQIGPLVEAIIVPNVRRAATTLSQHPKNLSDVWLVDDETAAQLPQGELIGELCLVGMGHATRVAPLPERPVLGRAARLAESERLQHEIDAFDVELSQLRSEQAGARRQREHMKALAPFAKWLDYISPDLQLNDAKADLESAERQIANAERRCKVLTEERQRLNQRMKTLNDCNLDAALIEGEEWAQTVLQLQEQEVHAAACQRKLEAQGVHLATLQKGLEILRAVPITDTEVAALETRCSALEASIRHHNDALGKLSHLVTQLDYFAYADQVELEHQKSGALATLAQQERLLTASVEKADSAREAADKLRTEADTTRSAAYSAWSDAAATLKTRQQELDRKNCPCDDAALEAAGQRVTDSQALHGAAKKSEIELNRTQGEVNNQLKAEYRMLAGTDHPNNLLSQARTATRVWVRLALEWGEFRNAVQREDAMLHTRLQEPEIAAKYQRQSFISLNADLGRLRQELQKTLTASHAVGVLPDQAAARSNRAELLPDWIGVRRYLEQSLPRDITQADNIQKALADITHALEEMRLRQHEQEEKFRTSAESIANSINNLVRREIMNVNRINNDKKLGDVRFGSITGVRIEASRIEHMTRFLDVLRREDDLFSDSRSLEDGLAFLYERSGGGTAQGSALLDYRKYIQVSIQVKRLGQNTWDTNLGTSSGEAIGVGAAILVVILDAMEHQSEMLQRRKVAGSIRFLMLDEANRLDHDSLEMMAGFCKAMSVQLLVAAPEIARARSGTTYCFVRRSGAQGQEVEVTYRGRRGFHAEESA